MSVPENTTYLITGANRGLGRALLEIYLSRPNTTLIAGVRDPSHPTAQSLSSLPHGASSKVIVVLIDSADHNTPFSAISELRTRFGIPKLDVVIANAAIGKAPVLVKDATVADLREHHDVNVIAPVMLFQACRPLMIAATEEMDDGKRAKFIGVSSSAGSLANLEEVPIPNAIYGPTKSALNYLIRLVHFDGGMLRGHESIGGEVKGIEGGSEGGEKGLLSFSLHPGWVQTEMGNRSAVKFGMGKADITVEESVNGMVQVIDNATLENCGGKFLDYKGKEVPW